MGDNIVLFVISTSLRLCNVTGTNVVMVSTGFSRWTVSEKKTKQGYGVRIYELMDLGKQYKEPTH